MTGDGGGLKAGMTSGSEATGASPVAMTRAHVAASLAEDLDPYDPEW